jgi:hypothetical protein
MMGEMITGKKKGRLADKDLETISEETHWVITDSELQSLKSKIADEQDSLK